MAVQFCASVRATGWIVRWCMRAGAALAGCRLMEKCQPVDHYEVLQIGVNAEPETLHRVYRMLAQRFHPDNAETGNETRFRQVAEAYRILSDPEERARYDVVHERQRLERWRLVNQGAQTENDFATEQHVRITVLEVLYTKRRVEPSEPGIFHIDLEKLTGRPREHPEFTTWYLVQKKLVQRTDSSLLTITADGIDYLEQHYQAAAPDDRKHLGNMRGVSAVRLTERLFSDSPSLAACDSAD